VPNDLKKGKKPLNVLTIRERILQNIILLSCSPIIECNADPLSFGFRGKRSAIQCITYLFKNLKENQIIKQTRAHIKTANSNNLCKKVQDFSIIRVKQRTRMLTKS